MTEPAMPSFSRRAAAAALVALPFCWSGARAQPSAALRATPRQTEGPFYPVALPKDADADLLRNGALQYTLGEPAWVEGTVSDLQGRPVAGAQVEIWQCDQAGHYHHPGDRGTADPRFQGFGRVTVGADGRYRFRTIRPAPYSGRTPHIHVKVKLDRRELLTTQLYVEGDPHNERDFLWRNLGEDRALVTVPFRRSGEGLQADFPIVLASA
ncbi:intradiol ring-cleavage dioxygenase [Ramlibacter sp. USB13]|uniref:Intradiol ring-cleavage dioxygenase n=2 Tax=Ramlibacter cellulosilyticus TaxID=2764187 RepID=A0A923MSR0_9BURK|nr:intradiol ring-cleavage dioxygenase [Ramlibacter cellulosilyticus]